MKPARPALAVLLLPALLVAACGPSEPSPHGPPGLVFEPASLLLGRLEPGEERRVRVRWRRTGAGPLCRHAVVATCSCHGSGALPRDLGEGARGRLDHRLHAPSREGPFVFGVRVTTDGRRRGGAAVHRLPVEGWVGRPLSAVPARLALGRSTPGRRVRRTVTVLLARALRARAVTARLEGAAPWEGTATVRPTPVSDRVQVDLDVLVPRRPGPAQAILLVSVPGTDGLRVPLAAEVVRSP